MNLAAKLLIKSDFKVRLINDPPGFRNESLPIPPRASLVGQGTRDCDAVLLFVSRSQELNQLGPEALVALKFDGIFWVAFPKKSAGVATDMGRDQGWEYLERQGFEGVSIVAIDDTWSAMRFRPFARKGHTTVRRGATGVERKALVLAAAAKQRAASQRKKKSRPKQKVTLSKSKRKVAVKKNVKPKPRAKAKKKKR